LHSGLRPVPPISALPEVEWDKVSADNPVCKSGCVAKLNNSDVETDCDTGSIHGSSIKDSDSVGIETGDYMSCIAEVDHGVHSSETGFSGQFKVHALLENYVYKNEWWDWLRASGTWARRYYLPRAYGHAPPMRGLPPLVEP
jgi:hypothetical protein